MENAVQPPSMQHAPAPASDAAKHFVTAGEKKFDRLTYTDIGYVANVLLSVAAVAAVERTQRGQQMIKGIGEWAEKRLNVKAASGEFYARKSFFLAGGFAVLAPMKWMEDAKVGLVKKWNRQIYGEQAANDPKILASEKKLEGDPKQTWSSIFASRALALVPFYVGYWLLWDKTSPLAKASDGKIFIDRPVVAASRWLGKMIGKVTGSGKAVAEEIDALLVSHPGELKSTLPAKELRPTTPHDPVQAVVPYYFISEAITSAMVAWGVYVLTRVLGPIFDKNKDHTMKPVPWQPSSSAIPITERQEREVMRESIPGRERDQPVTRVAVDRLEYQNRQQEISEKGLAL